MTKKKPEYIPFDKAQDRLRSLEGPTVISGPAGQTYTITACGLSSERRYEGRQAVTERGLKVELGEGWRIVYTSLITDPQGGLAKPCNVRNLRFEVLPVQRPLEGPAREKRER